MRVNTVTIKVPRSSSQITIIPVEPHYSLRARSNGFDRIAWFKLLKRVKEDPNCYLVFVGDIIDADRPSMREMKNRIYADQERRPALEEDDLDRMAGLRAGIIKDLRPIKHKILGAVSGDHFQQYSNGLDSTWYICNQLGIPKAYLGERMGFIRVQFQRATDNDKINFDVLVRHGRGGSGTYGGDVNALMKQSNNFIADLFLGGHTHKGWFMSIPFLWVNRAGEIKEKIISYCRAGSLLHSIVNGDTTYSEIAEYSPLKTGWPEISISVGRAAMNNGNMLVRSVRCTI